MPIRLHHSTSQALCADDVEIGRYGVLLDGLNIALLVFSADASPHSRNARATALLGDTLPSWQDENGQPLAACDQPALQALRNGRAVHERLIGLGEAQGAWFQATALPVLAADGSVRRVLLTLLDVSAQRQLAAEVEKLSLTDPLSGVSNRACIVQLLENEVHRARRYGTPFALAQVDVDKFLPFCQAHGESAGERVLADLGRLLRNSIREIDMVGRVSIDAFLLILPNVCLNDAMVGLERLRATIETHEFAEQGFRITISGGVTEYTGENAALLIERSRSLLLVARETGGNRLCLDMEIF